jgi:hypothetical protein
MGEPGAGGLPTLKLGLRYRAPLTPLPAATGHQLSYRDSNFPGRVGWQEIIAVAGPGITVVQSTVPAAHSLAPPDLGGAYHPVWGGTRGPGAGRSGSAPNMTPLKSRETNGPSRSRGMLPS